jgi:hypothetical protein
LRDTPLQAGRDGDPFVGNLDGTHYFLFKGGLGRFGLTPPLEGFDSLLSTESDQNAENDHADFACEDSPAVQRLGQSQ